MIGVGENRDRDRDRRRGQSKQHHKGSILPFDKQLNVESDNEKLNS